MRQGSRFGVEHWVPSLLWLGALACGEPVPPATAGSSDGGTVDGTTGLSGTGMVSAATGQDASTTASSGTSDGSRGDDSAGCGFLCPPDLPPPGTNCAPIEQDCPDGQKCVWFVDEPWGTLRRDAARCIEVTGDGQPFEPCTLPNGIGPEITDDCGPESYCLEVYGTADHGFCAPFMSPDGSCDAHPGTNGAIENGSDFPAACLHYECHPLVPGSCPEGMQCTFYPAFLYGTNMCWYVPPEAARPLGAACDPGECGDGQLCAPAQWVPGCTDDWCCAQWCDLNAPGCDEPAATCQLFPVWAADGDPDYEWLGACLVPGALE